MGTPVPLGSRFSATAFSTFSTSSLLVLPGLVGFFLMGCLLPRGLLFFGADGFLLDADGPCPTSMAAPFFRLSPRPTPPSSSEERSRIRVALQELPPVHLHLLSELIVVFFPDVDPPIVAVTRAMRCS
jgi:hypothetical protein